MQSTSIDEESRFNAVQIPEIEAQQMQSTSSSSNFTRTRLVQSILILLY